MRIDRLWAMQPGEWFFVATKSRSGEWVDKAFRRSQLKAALEFVEANKDKNLYICPHGFTRPQRKREYAVAPKLLWADLDEVDPRKVIVRPTMAWETSPGRYAALWVTDRPTTDELNQRWTYLLGADKGGWDYSQVLRLIAGSTNYKYPSRPKVKLLWNDGDSVEVSAIEKLAPTLATVKAGPDDWRPIYDKYERILPHWVRRELLREQVPIGKRSEMLWKLEHALLEAGVTRDESFSLIRASAWNKFSERRNGDEQLRHELDKALDTKKKSPAPEVNGEAFFATPMSEIEERDIDWVWYPYLARGELTLIDGDPGAGKSYLAQIVCGWLNDGKSLPSVEPRRIPPGKVLYFDFENSADTVTKKRLAGNGCKNLNLFLQEEAFFTIDDEDSMKKVYDAIELHRPIAVVFDTINGYIGSADTHKAAETTQALYTFRDIARTFQCAVIVLRHLNKNSNTNAMYRGQGSIAFNALARVSTMVTIDPDDPDRRLLSLVKFNNSGIVPALTFQIAGVKNEPGKARDRSLFEWMGFSLKYERADDILSAIARMRHDDEDEDFDSAVEFVKENLNGKWRSAEELRRMAATKGIDARLLDKVVSRMARSRGSGSRQEWAAAIA